MCIFKYKFRDLCFIKSYKLLPVSPLESVISVTGRFRVFETASAILNDKINKNSRLVLAFLTVTDVQTAGS